MIRPCSLLDRLSVWAGRKGEMMFPLGDVSVAPWRESVGQFANSVGRAAGSGAFGLQRRILRRSLVVSAASSHLELWPILPRHPRDLDTTPVRYGPRRPVSTKL